MRRLVVALVLVIAGLGVTAARADASTTDQLVSNGSPPTPFSQNKQNEPTVAIDAANPDIVVAGANDEIDMEACNPAADNTCPFTPGVGVSAPYFSLDGGATWQQQPTYTGLTARDCLGTPGSSDPPCSAHTGPIGTLPWYAENGLVSDGDPAVAFGPRPGPNGHFDWTRGARLYYANLTSNVFAARSEAAFKGFEAIAVSRSDDVQGAAGGDENAWMPPVLISHQSQTTFSDKEQIWADNASSSPHFGTVYVCWASFKGQEKGHAAPAPLQVGVSHDGGSTWTQHPLSAAANNSQRNPADGCTVRTDSLGTAYVFGVGTSSSNGKQAFELMSKSSDGGATWSRMRPVVGPVNQPGKFDPVQGSAVIDGDAGARSDLAPAPSVDIANGAPDGRDATDRMVMTYVSGPLATPHVYFAESANHGATWSTPRPIETAGDRGFYAAPAISPNGSDVYVVYNAFTTPFQPTTDTPRSLVGVVLHADSGPGGTGTFTSLNRGQPGDPRSSSANALTSEFLGDYVYAAASRTNGVAVWNDSRNGADCTPIDMYREALEQGQPATAPDVQQVCPENFGNSDIYGGTYPDPTP